MKPRVESQKEVVPGSHAPSKGPDAMDGSAPKKPPSQFDQALLVLDEVMWHLDHAYLLLDRECRGDIQKNSGAWSPLRVLRESIEELRINAANRRTRFLYLFSIEDCSRPDPNMFINLLDPASVEAVRKERKK